ncbi:hypothetical protein [Geodermatophilus sp. DF01-2]|uniref:hypothetical protein n=1 Tax=Geodermatophilus sp. DF01-2 TaxID=2559610 RepID=UPI00143154CC|nr:hypothetical protein [Geodermatophilus sp. DF01_2]
MDTLSASLTTVAERSPWPCVAGDIGPERREIECEPVADPAPVAPSPAPAPAPAAPAPA